MYSVPGVLSFKAVELFVNGSFPQRPGFVSLSLFDGPRFPAEGLKHREMLLNEECSGRSVAAGGRAEGEVGFANEFGAGGEDAAWLCWRPLGFRGARSSRYSRRSDESVLALGLGRESGRRVFGDTREWLRARGAGTHRWRALGGARK